MKYVDEFRDGSLARLIADRIRREARAERRYNLMEFCGGHTHAISRYGVVDLLPGSGHGPGGWSDVGAIEVYGAAVKRP